MSPIIRSQLIKIKSQGAVESLAVKDGLDQLRAKEDLSAVEQYLAPQPYAVVFGVSYLHLQLPDGTEL